MNIYIHEGVVIRKDNTLKIIKSDGSTHWLPIEKVSELNVFAGFTFSSEVLELFRERNISIHCFSFNGRYTGSFHFNKKNRNGKTLKQQVEYFESQKVNLSRVTINALLQNMSKFLTQYEKKNDAVARQSLSQIKQLQNKLVECKSVGEVMGIEGKSWVCFYNFLIHQHKEKWGFSSRNKRPPKDPINSMISFVNTLIYNRVETVFSKTDIYTELSYLHSSNQKRNSLVLDIAELYKIDITYRMTNRLLNKKMLKKIDFANKNLMCEIKPDARKIIIKEFEDLMKKTYYDESLKRNITLEYSMKLEAFKLLRGALEGEVYNPLVISEVNFEN